MNATKQYAAPADAADEWDEGEQPSDALAPVALRLTAADAGERLDKVLAGHLPQYSRSRLQQWIEAGSVTVDGRPGKVRQTVAGDEDVVVAPQASPEETAFMPEPMDLPVVYEDETIFVIDKPAGLVVHPAAGNWSGTLLNGLLHRFPPIAAVPRAGIVHRLDKDTSGLMVVAKTLQAQTDLVRQLQARTVRREYLALVWGAFPPQRTVSAAIGRHPRDRIKMAVLAGPSGKPAVTHFERLATGTLDRTPVSLVRCRLETGRTHQIRVHMLSAGFPLVGDPLYGKPHLSTAFPRQALHACRLGIMHPVSGKPCEWSAPLPADMAGLLARAAIAPDGEAWSAGSH